MCLIPYVSIDTIKPWVKAERYEKACSLRKVRGAASDSRGWVFETAQTGR